MILINSLWWGRLYLPNSERQEGIAHRGHQASQIAVSRQGDEFACLEARLLQNLAPNGGFRRFVRVGAAPGRPRK